MNVIKRIKLDFGHPSKPVVVWAKQGDKDSRIIEIEPMFNGMFYTLPNDSYATFACKKPDKHIVYDQDDHLTIENNIISVTLSHQTLIVHGDALCAIILHDSDGSILSTQNFILKIAESPLDLEDVNSESELGDLLDKMGELNNVVKSVNGVSPDENGNVDISVEKGIDLIEFDLVSMGLPNIPSDGTSVSVECDTVDIRAALAENMVKFVFNVEYNGLVFAGASFVVSPSGEQEAYQSTGMLSWGNVLGFINIIVSETGIVASARDINGYIDLYLSEALGGDY